MKPYRAAPLLLVLAALCSGLLAAPSTRAQQPPTPDPRDVKDPREAKDPRTAGDPRGTPLPAGGDQFSALEGKALYDALYASGNEGRLAAAFKADGWNILGYIDTHCEGWLALLEQGADQKEEGKQKILEMQTKGRSLAATADRALGDTRFTAYVQNFYGWNAEQRKAFREGQALFKQAEGILAAANSPQEALAAVTPLRQSLERSRPLGDTWGQSMALAVLGRVQEQNDQLPEAQATMGDAVRLGREIRDLDSVWNGLAVQYQAGARARQYDAAKAALQEQYLIALDLQDEKIQQKVQHQLLELDQIFTGKPMSKPPGPR
jgi:hypothetical protein